MKGLVK